MCKALRWFSMSLAFSSALPLTSSTFSKAPLFPKFKRHLLFYEAFSFVGLLAEYSFSALRIRLLFATDLSYEHWETESSLGNDDSFSGVCSTILSIILDNSESESSCLFDVLSRFFGLSLCFLGLDYTARNSYLEEDAFKFSSYSSSSKGHAFCRFFNMSEFNEDLLASMLRSGVGFLVVF